MPIIDPLDLSHIMGWLISIVVALLSFLGFRLHQRQDRHDIALAKLAESQATFQGLALTRADFSEIEERAEQHRDERHKENRERLAAIDGKLDKQTAINQRLMAVERAVQELRDWKHEIIDPYFPGEFNAMKRQLDRIERLLDQSSPRRRGMDAG